MSYELTGKLIIKNDAVQRSETFKTREFVIEKTDDIGGRTITNYAKFQCVQDKTTILDKYNIGDNVKVLFNIKGTRWEKNGVVNYITNLDAWNIQQVLSGNMVDNTPQQQTNAPIEPLDNFSSSDAVDDLPF